MRKLLIYICLCVCGFPAVAQSGKNPEQMLELPETADQIIFHKLYSLSFDKVHNVPKWVAWELSRAIIPNNNLIVRDGQYFTPDPALGPISPVSSDYTNSGYDRGHMCPANDCRLSGETLLESMYMSNICPQRRELNRGSWLKLEDKCHQTWVLDGEGEIERLYICCGPILSNREDIIIGGDNRYISVPKEFFKAILAKKTNGSYFAAGFIFTQQGYVRLVSIDSLENIINMNLFCNLPERVQNKVESKEPVKTDWPQLIETMGKWLQ